MLTCGAWVKRGIAKKVPDKIELTTDDLNRVLEGTKDKLKDLDENVDIDGLLQQTPPEEDEEDIAEEEDQGDNDDDDDVEEEGTPADKPMNDEAITEEYGLDGYDDEGVMMSGAGMDGLLYFSQNEEDPYVNLKSMNEEDKEDFQIKPDDNLFVVGKMEEDHSCLEIYVYNEDEDSLYVHHDIILESFPLCVEWLNFDPTEDEPGNYIAIGTMEPSIEIWDLDVVDTIEPVFVLKGKKKKKKSKTKTETGEASGHTDAVLGISWNKNVNNVLASASADGTVKLWDMSTGSCVHTLSHHKDKVQCVSWHPYEPQSLLTGSFDKSVAVLDCRKPDEAMKSWKLAGECEQAIWNHFSPFNFFSCTDNGVVCYHDVRSDAPVFTLHAHDAATTGVSLSMTIPGCLTTVSADKILKVWDFTDNHPACVVSREMKMGRLHFVTGCPDSGFVFACGGEKDGLRMLDIMATTAGKEHFANRAALRATTDENKTEPTEVKMDEATSDAMSALSLKLEQSTTKQNIVKKKKKKKKK